MILILVTCLFLCCVQMAVSQSKQCGVRVEDVTFAVFNSGDDPKIAPWAVSIGYADEDEDYHHHCSGSIVNGRFIEYSNSSVISSWLQKKLFSLQHIVYGIQDLTGYCDKYHLRLLKGSDSWIMWQSFGLHSLFGNVKSAIYELPHKCVKGKNT